MYSTTCAGSEALFLFKNLVFGTRVIKPPPKPQSKSHVNSKRVFWTPRAVSYEHDPCVLHCSQRFFELPFSPHKTPPQPALPPSPEFTEVPHK